MNICVLYPREYKQKGVVVLSGIKRGLTPQIWIKIINQLKEKKERKLRITYVY